MSTACPLNDTDIPYAGTPAVDQAVSVGKDVRLHASFVSQGNFALEDL